MGENVEECFAAAIEFAAETGALFVPPFDYDAVIAGQGTVALEMSSVSAPDIENIIVPIGGGGLISGVAAAAKQWAEQTDGRSKS